MSLRVTGVMSQDWPGALAGAVPGSEAMCTGWHPAPTLVPPNRPPAPGYATTGRWPCRAVHLTRYDRTHEGPSCQEGVLGPSGFPAGASCGRLLPGLGDDVRPAPVPARRRQRRPGQVAGRLARSASSASMALMCARMGPRTGEPGNARLRLTIRWRRARSSSLSVIALTSWTRLSGIGSPRALWSSHAGDAAHAGQHVPVTVVRLRRPLRPGPCLGNAGPGQFQPVEELHDAGG